ncbi:uncharacterized protein LOC18442338 [Amborella trichopoda]|uniref:Uncharacterized protein n=1 Tax=Amborella trichopoda TaxID=13333 RepID=W1PVN5_AMBTC|nr:uncharacterized protein LOC18442338 [Amborella trichopoda]ERN14087.1 hypothetical protein AMTR_s00021p00230830 [Amborella trichopoda]|eukprot:XP_006852620.1 uncharacterized protein LOC18442338 [Amborella trichopoda]
MATTTPFEISHHSFSLFLGPQKGHCSRGGPSNLSLPGDTPPPTLTSCSSSFSHSVSSISHSVCCSASLEVPETGPEEISPLPLVSEDGFLGEEEDEIQGTSNASLRGCKGCGREEIERGCNGEGRIQGGIATVPGFGWWPIKAYRPCPGFVASGGRYRRQGQSMDEVASGGGYRRQGQSMDEVAFRRDERGNANRTKHEVQSSKKKPSARRFRS